MSANVLLALYNTRFVLHTHTHRLRVCVHISAEVLSWSLCSDGVMMLRESESSIQEENTHISFGNASVSRISDEIEKEKHTHLSLSWRAVTTGQEEKNNGCGKLCSQCESVRLFDQFVFYSEPYLFDCCPHIVGIKCTKMCTLYN